jgi:DNA-directed RNA polymerase II subunit RPB2
MQSTTKFTNANNDAKQKVDEEEDTPFDLLGDPYRETPWDVIQSYFKDDHLNKLVRHHLESYNNFTDTLIENTIKMFNPIKSTGFTKTYYPIEPKDSYVFNENGTVEEPSTDEYGNVVMIPVEQPFKTTQIDVKIYMTNFTMSQPQIHENSGAVKVMFPNEARLRNFIYSAGMAVDMNITYTVHPTDPTDETQSAKTFTSCFPQIQIGKMPIMVKSNICVLSQYNHLSPADMGECPFDTGGYFIIKGSEKIILTQKRIAENNIMCGPVPKTQTQAKDHTKYSHIAEIRCIPLDTCISPKQVNVYYSRKCVGVGHPIYVKLPRIKPYIPLFVVFRAMGVLSDKDICELVIGNISESKTETETHQFILHDLHASIVDANEYLTQQVCISYIASQIIFTPAQTAYKQDCSVKKCEFVNEIIQVDTFAHCSTMAQKQAFLGYMTNKLLMCALNIVEPDSRDSYLNSRGDTSGALLNTLLRNHMNKMVKDAERQIVREIKSGSWKSINDYTNIINMTNIYKIFKSSTVEKNIATALSSGDFGIKYINSNKAGVAQVYNRMSYASSLSHARNLSTPDKTGKLIAPRKLQGTSWGIICPAETPEGESVGNVLNLSYMTYISIQSCSEFLYKYISSACTPLGCPTVSRKIINGPDTVKVFLNGSWIGITVTPNELYTDLKQKKYQGIISVYTSIVFKYTECEIWVTNLPGRFMRPVLKVKDGNIMLSSSVVRRLKSGELTWNDLLVSTKLPESVIEYIDVGEHCASVVALHPREIATKPNMRFTHCEIHQSTILGILASFIPFPDHNQSPRNTYQCAQTKQTIGINATNFHLRMDKTMHIMNYPQKPLVDTRTMNILKLNKLPAGMNITVAIMSHTGYNQEDSILFNQGSIDRGLGTSTVYHTERDEDTQKNNGYAELRGKPIQAKTMNMKYGNYDKVNCSGVIPKNTLVENRDVIIAKVTTIKENRNDPSKVIKYNDQSVTYKTKEPVYIDHNYCNTNGDGYTFVKVRIRNTRKPVIGDKFSSRHGQKGTIGNIIPEKNMPFTSDGRRPDIIVNPHAIPSRMTVGQLKETVLGKVLLQLGLFGDGTSFGDLTIADISEELKKIGLQTHGEELLYDGLTGEQMECSIFMGPVFYQRLKHMVGDKVHSRAVGPTVNLTRQPMEGRCRNGGLRIGEMERDCIISHGIARFNKDRLFDSSDKYQVYACNKCGGIASVNLKKSISCCLMCGNSVDFSHVQLPYACKLLFQELNTMNISPRLITDTMCCENKLT